MMNRRSRLVTRGMLALMGFGTEPGVAPKDPGSYEPHGSANGISGTVAAAAQVMAERRSGAGIGFPFCVRRLRAASLPLEETKLVSGRLLAVLLFAVPASISTDAADAAFGTL